MPSSKDAPAGDSSAATHTSDPPDDLPPTSEPPGRDEAAQARRVLKAAARGWAGKMLRRGRAWLMRGGAAAVVILAACCFALGYWVIGNGFAHSPGWGALGVLLTLVIASAAMLAARWRQGSWPSWLRYPARIALVGIVAAAGLSAGAAFGSTHFAPPCGAPTELTVLTSPEALGAVQAAIPGFEQNEPARVHTSCYPVDVTAYAAPTDSEAWRGFETGWGMTALSTVGPRPDIWIPSSSAELATVRAHNGPQFTRLGSIASSPLVIAVPTGLVTGPLARLPRQGAQTTWRSIYNALGQDNIGLDLPDPTASETAQLGIAGLYPALTPAEEREIESSGSFPADSGSLLCDAAQSDEQGDHRAATAYLVSEAALIASHAGRLTEGACAALTQQPGPLTAFYPAGAPALDFPFTTVDWGGSTTTSKTLSTYETGFYDWLTGPARPGLTKWGLRPPHCGKFSRAPAGTVTAVAGCAAAARPTAAAVASALGSFKDAQAPAHIVIGIDDSGPMQPYLPQITAAVDAELGPGATHIGSRDSFGIWKLPGDRKGQLEQQLVGFGPAGTTEARVPSDVGVLTGHDHSADYAMLTSAGQLLYAQPTANPEPTNAVILLTDGDGYPQGDPGGSSEVTVTGYFGRAPTGYSAIKLYIIAFGPEGCAERETGSASESLGGFANSAGGTCLPANGADPHQLLAQVLGQISTGG